MAYKTTLIHIFLSTVWMITIALGATTDLSIQSTGELGTPLQGNHLLEEVKTYPNPTLDKLTIDLSTVEYPNVKVTIFNTIQLAITSFSTYPRLMEINLSHYKPGVYYIRFQYQNDVLIKKFVKK